ncbi:uncharacterized protein LOC126905715 [Daktulosphaira vitifoliae]|uniref:uncharacterized protein LOC126905715 n=1 Tax=Daktulosphaira vitifoliae TaxID=58002 RepID=UPI0021AA1A23|nr:uncharacterized protein LOC126905715 [Daktulosphaira vitifoliae]
MGKVRRYKKKIAKVNLAEEKITQVTEKTDYMQLAEELLRMKKDNDKMSVCSVMKSVKSSNGEECLKLKKDAKRYLKHAFLLKRLEKNQKGLKKNKNNDNEDDDSCDDDNSFGNQKVLNWPTGNKNEIYIAPAKKLRKGHQKKLNAQMAKDLVSFSKQIKKNVKHPRQNALNVLNNCNM